MNKSQKQIHKQYLILSILCLVVLILSTNPKINTIIYKNTIETSHNITSFVKKQFRLTFKTDVIDNYFGYQFYQNNESTSNYKELDFNEDIKRIYITKDAKQIIDETNKINITFPKDTFISFDNTEINASFNEPSSKLGLNVKIKKVDGEPQEILKSTLLNEDYQIENNLIQLKTGEITSKDYKYNGAYFYGSYIMDLNNSFVCTYLSANNQTYLLKIYGALHNDYISKQVINIYNSLSINFN